MSCTVSSASGTVRCKGEGAIDGGGVGRVVGRPFLEGKIAR
jgi:hypothetical protein